MVNYYQILGIQTTANDHEIKKAYHQLALKYHPDRNPGDENAKNMFIIIQEAYEILINPDKKRNFDYSNKTTTNKKPHRKPNQRPYKDTSFVYSDAPPPKFDIWGQPITKEHDWKDSFKDAYESDGQPNLR